jgi:hypothetical protein
MKVSVQLADHGAGVAQTLPRILVPTPRAGEFPRNSMDLPFQIQTYSSVLGVQTEGLTRQLGEYFGVKDGEGVLVRSVEKNSAAEKAGLKAGDVIVKADNEKLTDRSDLSHILRNHRTGGKMTVVVMRDKHEQTLTVTLPDRGSRDSSFLDLDAEALQASLANAEGMFQALDTDNIIFLNENMAALGRNKSLLDMAQRGRDLLASPEIQKAMREAQKALQDLKLGSDPI